MEAMDERRVWQRVRGSGEPDRAEQVRACLNGQGPLLSAYRQLSRRGGRYRQLYEEKCGQVAALRGLLRVLTGQGAAMPHCGAGPVDLMRCFEREQVLLAELTELGGGSPLGPVFAALAERQKRHCCRLLELLGSS